MNDEVICDLSTPNPSFKVTVFFKGGK